MTNIDRFIPLAFKAINKVKLEIINKKGVTEVKRFVSANNSIPKVYKGYISSFGANIIQAGIKTAVYFYEAAESSSEGDKRLVSAAIKFMLFNTNGDVSEYGDYQLSQEIEKISEPHKMQLITLKIMDAATALKLALRTFKME